MNLEPLRRTLDLRSQVWDQSVLQHLAGRHEQEKVRSLQVQLERQSMFRIAGLGTHKNSFQWSSKGLFTV
jgi:hypothetical protein